MATSEEPSPTPPALSSPVGSTSTAVAAPNDGARAPRRLILFCDGTGRDGAKGKTKHDSNVWRLYRVIEAAASTDGDIEQVLLWQPGVGMEKDEHLIEGVTAGKLKYKIKKAYLMLQSAYTPGDSIVLIGFSRGAFICRMIAAILGDIGLSQNSTSGDLDEIFEAYSRLPKWSEDRGTKKEQKARPKVAAALEVLARYRARGPATVRVSALAIFDTVGALGLRSKTHLPQARYFGFPVEEVGPHVDHTFHCLAADDARSAFRETRVELTDEGREKGQDVRQCWFGGWHTDVGGGWAHGELAAIPLIWMAAHLLQLNLIGLDESSLLAIPGVYLDTSKHPVSHPPLPSFSSPPKPPPAPPAFIDLKPPSKPWGDGTFWADLYPLLTFGPKAPRPPISGSDTVHESAFSPSQVAWRRKKAPAVQDALERFPREPLMELEVKARERWPER